MLSKVKNSEIAKSFSAASTMDSEESPDAVTLLSQLDMGGQNMVYVGRMMLLDK